MSLEATTDYKSLYEQQLQSNAHLQLQLSQLTLQLQELQRLIFGSRHERFIPENNNPGQLHLDLSTETIAAPGVVDTKQVTSTRNTSEITESKSHPIRMKLPEHLTRKEVILEPGVDVSGLRRLGEEITEEQDYEPGSLFVRRIIRPKYLSKDNQSFIIAPMVARPLPKAIAGAGLLTQVIIDKFIDHLPLNRQ